MLTLTTMRFADEVVPASELDILPEKAAKPAKREQEMAEQLIESLSTDFEPSAYKDEYREQLLGLIERKAEGKEIVASDAEAPKATKAPDLMAALEESIAAVGRPQRRGEIESQSESEIRSAKKRRRKRRQSQGQSQKIARRKKPRGRKPNRNRPSPWRRAARSRSKAVS